MFTKIWKGFNEFHDVGLIDKPTTRMHMAQPVGSSPIVTAYDEGVKEVRPIRPNTIAKSLAIGNPADGYYALNIIEKTNGTAHAVPDEVIVESIQTLASTEGIFTETAGGVTIGVLKALVEEGTIKKDDLTVAYITGNGLKTQEAVESLVNTVTIDPDFASFEKNLGLKR